MLNKNDTMVNKLDNFMCQHLFVVCIYIVKQ